MSVYLYIYIMQMETFSLVLRKILQIVLDINHVSVRRVICVHKCIASLTLVQCLKTFICVLVVMEKDFLYTSRLMHMLFVEVSQIRPMSTKTNPHPTMKKQKKKI